MDGWKISFSPGGLACNAAWEIDGQMVDCTEIIRPGYVVAEHDNYPGERMCLSCMVATVRQHLRTKGLE